MPDFTLMGWSTLRQMACDEPSVVSLLLRERSLQDCLAGTHLVPR